MTNKIECPKCKKKQLYWSVVYQRHKCGNCDSYFSKYLVFIIQSEKNHIWLEYDDDQELKYIYVDGVLDRVLTDNIRALEQEEWLKNKYNNSAISWWNNLDHDERVKIWKKYLKLKKGTFIG
ncbi:MAG: hypothetical protein DRN27_09555 [Thermoplasmata archaeon]|nr:MAG: hypothetical protein DRN27_09555 [Thermoplasmata archaeon]